MTCRIAGSVKRIRSNRPAWVLIVGAIIADLAVLPACPNTLPEGKSPHSPWTMIYEAGPAPIQIESGLTVTINEENVVLQPKKGSPFAIPVAAITAVSSNLVSRRTASLNQANAWLNAVEFSPYTLMALPFGLGAMAATLPIKSHYAYIGILWKEKGTEQEILLKLSKRDDYTPFLAELQKATGKEWKNLDTEWASVQQELRREGTNKVSFRLDRRVRIVKSSLAPGTYQVVLLEREGSHGELFFFPGNQVNVEHMAAVALVEIISSTNEAGTTRVSYKRDTDGIATISDIQMASKILRFP
jgi:hypothetical protein